MPSSKSTATRVEKPVLKALHASIDNKPGELAKVTRALADAHINIEAVEAEILGRSAFFRFYTQTPSEAEAVLRRLGLITIGMEVVEVFLQNKPGELARMCELLAAKGINIESTFGSSHPSREATYYLRVDKPLEANRVLAAAGFLSRKTTK